MALAQNLRISNRRIRRTEIRLDTTLAALRVRLHGKKPKPLGPSWPQLDVFELMSTVASSWADPAHKNTSKVPEQVSSGCVLCNHSHSDDAYLGDVFCHLRCPSHFSCWLCSCRYDMLNGQTDQTWQSSALEERCTCSYGTTRVVNCIDGPQCKETGGYTNDVHSALYMATWRIYHWYVIKN